MTGSKTYVEFGECRILIDSGMYQGENNSEKLNLQDLGLDVQKIDYIFLTHGHLDHCGHLPVIVKAGFSGEIFCTHGTKEIVKIILEDAVKVQQYNLKEGKINSIFYDEVDVERTLSFFKTFKLNDKKQLKEFSFEFFEAGHILGASSLVLEVNNKRFCFSGDVGRGKDVLHRHPDFPKEIDYLVLESTYGDRLHPEDNTLEKLENHIKRVKETHGVLLIPAFAVARTQVVMKYLFDLFESNSKLKIPVYVDSPMGVKVTRLYQESFRDLKLSEDQMNAIINNVKLLEFGNDFKKLVRAKKPFVLISSSGMISGGKVLKYFDMYAKHEDNTILLTGFQGIGTIGYKVTHDEKEINLNGHKMLVRADIDNMTTLSAHADREELLANIRNSKRVPQQVFLNHGEADTLISFKNFLNENLDSKITIAEKDEFYEVGE